MNSTGRNYFVDALRGFTMISMVLYHTCYDIFVAFGRDPGFINSTAAYIWQQSICISFILISGMVWPFGKKNALKRGVILLALGYGITLFTSIFMPDEAIHYGILTFMGIATIVMVPLDKFGEFLSEKWKLGKKHPVAFEIVLLVICLLLFVVTRHFPDGYIGTRSSLWVSLPEALYQYPVLAPIGFPAADFYSADYFSVLPWIFLYFTGYHLGKILFANEGFQRLGSHKIPFLSFLGTKSLLIYIIHQPVCYGIVWLIFH